MAPRKVEETAKNG